MREALVENHLVREVAKRGGEIRKAKWIGRNGCPDRYVMLPDRPPTWVELKAPGLDAEDHQAREHRRMQRLGCRVMVLDTKEKIDEWLRTGSVDG